MKDELGERMKCQYEDRTRYFVPRRTYTIIRLDGKAFHTYTKKLDKPFDSNLYSDIDNAIITLLPHIQGAVFAYTQSDEISVLVTDFALPTTSAWFDGNIQKIVSVSSSIITAEFNHLRRMRHFETQPTMNDFKLAYFDARIFTIPDRIEVMNYFIWRNQDCARNSVSMLAQANFSHKELQSKSTIKMIEMLDELEHPNFSWHSLHPDLKFGRLIVKEKYLDTAISPTTCVDFERNRWAVKSAWKFSENKEPLLNMIPKYE
jgi:tRNA(His) 5'-end guanylyltransferase